MKKIIKTFYILFLACMLIIPVQAADKPTITLPIKISLTGSIPNKPEDYEIKLVADDITNPMPLGSVNGIFTMKITGANTVNLSAISLEDLGTYTYTLYQSAGNNKKCTYDDIVYRLTIYVINGNDGNLQAIATLYSNKDEIKHSQAIFTNSYKKDASPSKPNKTNTGNQTNFTQYLALALGSIIVIAILLMDMKQRYRKMEG